jgi:hypothetical protein
MKVHRVERPNIALRALAAVASRYYLELREVGDIHISMKPRNISIVDGVGNVHYYITPEENDDVDGDIDVTFRRL